MVAGAIAEPLATTQQLQLFSGIPTGRDTTRLVQKKTTGDPTARDLTMRTQRKAAHKRRRPHRIPTQDVRGEGRQSQQALECSP